MFEAPTVVSVLISVDPWAWERFSSMDLAVASQVSLSSSGPEVEPCEEPGLDSAQKLCTRVAPELKAPVPPATYLRQAWSRPS